MSGSAGFRWLAPGTSARDRRLAAEPGTSVVRLLRRGFDYGFVVSPASLPEKPPAAVDPGAPTHLPGILAAALEGHRADVQRTLGLLEEIRSGATLAPHIHRRLRAQRRFRAAGTSVDLGEPREIEKVHADALTSQCRRRLVGDLYAKLSWVSTDRRDPSLRIRFSFGSERLRDWMKSPRRAVWADRYAQAVFPECAVLAENRPLHRWLRRRIGSGFRLSERIVYSNAPGGGAVFHHDAEPHQVGVIYGQLAGETLWLALPKRRLAQILAPKLGRKPTQILHDLDGHGDRRLERALNESPQLVGELVAEGWCHRLRAGDAIHLPSPTEHDVAWHSVFGIGDSPSLALSFAIFPKSS